MRKGAGLAAIVLMGCAGMRVVEVDGHKVRQEDWDNGAKRVAALASFDLSCSKDQLELQLVDASGYMPVSVGVRGCGASARYTRVSGTNTWELNSNINPGEAALQELEGDGQKSLLIEKGAP